MLLSVREAALFHKGVVFHKTVLFQKGAFLRKASLFYKAKTARAKTATASAPDVLLALSYEAIA